MKKNNLHKMDPKNFKPDDAYFTEESKGLNQKIMILDSWKTTVSQNPDSIFPVPEGFWWKMEEAIREKISGPVFQSKTVFQTHLAWVLGTVLLLVVASVLWVTFPPGNSLESSDYQSLINQSKVPEMMAYLDDTDWSDWEMQNEVRSDEFEIPISINPVDVESDLEENFDQWMN